MIHLAQHVTSTITCDTDGCPQKVTITQDVDERQAAELVRLLGWTAQLGAQRYMHWCRRHTEVKR